jgi:hypothetical protein
LSIAFEVRSKLQEVDISYYLPPRINDHGYYSSGSDEGWDKKKAPPTTGRASSWNLPLDAALRRSTLVACSTLESGYRMAWAMLTASAALPLL